MRPDKLDRRMHMMRGRFGKMIMETRSMVRRFAVSKTSTSLWDLLGFEDDEGSQETTSLETFQGVGYVARPNESHNSEAIAVKIGGKSGHSVIVGDRDNDGLRAFAEKQTIDAGEVAIFNDSVMVKLTTSGEILIGSHGGTFQALATKADLQSLVTTFNTHVHPGLSAPIAPPNLAAAPIGTQKLKAE